MRDRLALNVAWLATLWLAEILVLSIVDFARGMDVVALAVALPVQLGVVVAWSLVPRLPLWLVGGHGLIMLGLAVGLVVAGPAWPALTTLFGLPLPWLVVGLVPTGAAMVVAASVAWKPSDSLVH